MPGRLDKKNIKTIFLILLCLVLLLVVRYSTKDIKNASEKQALDGLKQLFSDADPDFLSDNSAPLLLPDGREISISIFSQDEMQKHGMWISPFEIYVIIAGYHQTEFDYGTIGIDEIKEEARKTALDEWLEAFGNSFVFATITWEWGIDLNNFTAYPGSIGFRGSCPGDWLDGSFEMHQKILSGLIPILENSSTFDFNGKRTQTVDLKININEQGVYDGECRLNREVSLDILKVMEKLDWPTTNSSYLIKQYYIIIYD